MSGPEGHGGRFIDVVVEEHDDIPDGCELRFHAVGERRPISRIRYEPLTGAEGDFDVRTAAGGQAYATPVDDSSAGTSILVTGDDRGLRLWRTDAPHEAPIPEPYLLLAPEAILD